MNTRDSLLFYIDIVLLAVCLVIWLQPSLVTISAISLVIGWAYGVITARIVRSMIQYISVTYGVNRPGMLIIAGLFVLMGCVVIYIGYTSLWYAALGFGSIVALSSIDTFRLIAGRKTALVSQDIVTTLEYLVIALLVLALFDKQLEDTYIASLDIFYAGVAGYKLLFIVTVITICVVGKELWGKLRRKIKRIFATMRTR